MTKRSIKGRILRFGIAFIAAMALGACVGTAQQASPEWRAYGLLSQYDVLHQTLNEMRDDEHVSARTAARLKRLDERIRGAVTKVARAARNGDNAGVRRHLPKTQAMLYRQMSLISMDPEVEWRMRKVYRRVRTMLASGERPSRDHWNRLLAQLEGDRRQVAVAD